MCASMFSDATQRRSGSQSATSHGSGVGRPRIGRDGLVVIDGRAVAVEVELTQKERRRAAGIMGQLVAAHRSVSYFAAPAPRRQLERLAQEIGGGRVQVLPLPEEGR